MRPQDSDGSLSLLGGGDGRKGWGESAVRFPRTCCS